MFRISSRPQLPASPPVPSAQARKGWRPGHNRRKHYAIFKELPPFRNWVLGQGQDAGRFGTDTGRALTGKIGADATDLKWIRDHVSGAFKILNTPGVGSGNVMDSYRGNYSVNFDASYIWGASHSGAEFAPSHIWQPVILYLGRPR